MANSVPGMVKMIRGQGMPSYRHHDYGNMYITFDVQFPEKNWTTDEKAFQMLKSILPASTPVNIPPPDAMTDDSLLEDVDPTQRGRTNSAMDDDDDDGHPGAERVQCASQ